jgi:hypothetical protein
MRYAAACIAITVLAGCAVLAPPQPGLRISNFAQGLARLDDAGAWYIYDPGNVFPYAVNGVCIVAGQSKPCMWHAAQFDFDASSEASQLDCVAELSSPSEIVTPEKIESAPTRRFEFSFQLEGRSGRRVFPGYTVSSGVGPPDKTRTVCRHAGRVVFTSAFTVLPAASPP